jgi:hypothetical protein
MCHQTRSMNYEMSRRSLNCECSRLSSDSLTAIRTPYNLCTGIIPLAPAPLVLCRVFYAGKVVHRNEKFAD